MYILFNTGVASRAVEPTRVERVRELYYRGTGTFLEISEELRDSRLNIFGLQDSRFFDDRQLLTRSVWEVLTANRSFPLLQNFQKVKERRPV